MKVLARLYELKQREQGKKTRGLREGKRRTSMGTPDSLLTSFSRTSS
jgi:hypothetical protein